MTSPHDLEERDFDLMMEAMLERRRCACGPDLGACAPVAEIKRLQAQNANLQDALMGVVASLAAAISLLVRGGKAIKKTVASDKMFDQMMVDYRASIDQAVLAYKQGTPE